MQENLNQLESAILKEIIEVNKDQYPFLEDDFQFLCVKNREYTGVGSYTNFTYVRGVEERKINILISSPKSLYIDDLKNELTYVLDVTNGKINFLEIVTNGDEEWDGKYKSFHFANNAE